MAGSTDRRIARLVSRKQKDLDREQQAEVRSAEILSKYRHTADELIPDQVSSRCCDYCNAFKPPSDYRTDYDTTCAECLTVKEYLIQQRKENVRRLHKQLAVHTVKHHVVVHGVELKHCSACGVFLPLDNFYSQTKSSDGLARQCKECTRLKVQVSRLRKRARKLGINADI